jgi:hypothetical protein
LVTLKVRVHKTCALLRDNVELLPPAWFGSLVWNPNSQILGRPCMNPQQVKIDFNKNPVYEGGATLLALLACPANGRSENRNAGLHASLCGKALWAYHLSNPENAIRTTVNLQHVFRDAKVIDRETNFVARRLGERLVAGRMAIPFLQKAELGCQPQLPSAIKRLSVNQMAEFVLDDIGHADSNNVKRRVWAPSRPVIHLAAAATMIGQELRRKGIQTGFEYLLLCRELIEAIVLRAKLLEEIIAKDPRFPVKAETLIRVRLV